jgi:F0F1-type ATP synthase assembly protein I
MANVPPPSKTRTAAGLVLIGSELVAPAVVGVAIDLCFGTMPWATVVCTLIGAAIAAWHGYVVLTRLPS